MGAGVVGVPSVALEVGVAGVVGQVGVGVACLGSGLGTMANEAELLLNLPAEVVGEVGVGVACLGSGLGTMAKEAELLLNLSAEVVGVEQGLEVHLIAFQAACVWSSCSPPTHCCACLR